MRSSFFLRATAMATRVAGTSQPMRGFGVADSPITARFQAATLRGEKSAPFSVGNDHETHGLSLCRRLAEQVLPSPSRG